MTNVNDNTGGLSLEGYKYLNFCNYKIEGRYPDLLPVLFSKHTVEVSGDMLKFSGILAIDTPHLEAGVEVKHERLIVPSSKVFFSGKAKNNFLHDIVISTLTSKTDTELNPRVYDALDEETKAKTDIYTAARALVQTIKPSNFDDARQHEAIVSYLGITDIIGYAKVLDKWVKTGEVVMYTDLSETLNLSHRALSDKYDD